MFAGTPGQEILRIGQYLVCFFQFFILVGIFGQVTGYPVCIGFRRVELVLKISERADGQQETVRVAAFNPTVQLLFKVE